MAEVFPNQRRSALTITENDLKGACRRLNIRFDLLEGDIKKLQTLEPVRGAAVLAAGEVRVACPQVTSDSLILLTAQTASAGNEGELSVIDRAAGAFFVIGSTSATDDRKVAYLIWEP